MKEVNDIIGFIKEKAYRMINNNLGQGSFGRTVLLKDESIDELFVCKKFEPYYKDDTEQFYEAFKREIKIMYKLNHKNIVRIYNYYLFNEHKTGYIIMEYINGNNIDDYFSNHENINVDDIFIQLIEAFACLEKNNIFHRDIRSSNIMIDEGGVVKLIDFGLGKIYTSKKISQDSLNEEINRMGMELIPSELTKGIYTIKTDMFCIAELYNRLLKKHNIKEFKYDNILNKMLQVDPNKRYDSFEKILETINNKQFQLLTVTEEDKKVYKNFSNSLIKSLSSYSELFKMEDNISKILADLQIIINNNCFEDIIVSNSSLISIFVKCPYKYYKKEKVETIDVINFYNWISNKDDQYQQIILNNLKIKLQTIETKVEYDDDDLPF